MYVVSGLLDRFINFSFNGFGMKTLGIVMTFRIAKDEAILESSICVRYYINSAELTVRQLAHVSRERWSIENKLHWKLDATMCEDGC